MKSNKSKRVLIIGAGPVGIAAAAHLLSRGINPIVLEKGYFVGSAMSEWGHVRLFSPWKYLIDKEVCKLLENHGWQAPDSEELPTGQEIVDQYLKPAADTQELKTSIILGAEVTGVSKQGHAKSSSKDRDDAAFTIHYKLTENKVNIISADSVIDTSGTWYNPNPIGLDGLAVPGEVENKNNIVYGIPDVITKDRADYEGKRVLVLGGGHSAINVALELLKIQSSNPDTRIVWGLRSNNLEKLIGGGINDELPARGKLGIAAKSAVEAGLLDLLAPFEVRRISKLDSGLIVNALVDGKEEAFELDRIIVAAGFRPDLNIHRELRLDVDDIVEAPTQLAPLIDPNLHSCGTVSPHGVRELTHHDKNFYIAGMKAYGRAPTFLMLTGYEQVRSIAAELAGDHEEANRVELVLPKTGVCSSTVNEAGSSCCERGSSDNSSTCCGSIEVDESVENSCCRILETKQAASSCC